MFKRSTLIGAAVATALGVAQTASAQTGVLQLNLTDFGLGFHQVQSMQSAAADVIFKDIIDGDGSNPGTAAGEANTNDGEVVFVGQGHGTGTNVGGGATPGQFTYQWIFNEDDGASVDVEIGSSSDSAVINATDGIVRLFFNPNTSAVIADNNGTIGDDSDDTSGGGGVSGGDINDKDGICFGDLGGDPLCNAANGLAGPAGDQVMLFEGTISMVGDPLSLTTANADIDLLDGGADDMNRFSDDETGTTSMGGGATFIIDVTTQNRDYLVNEYVDNTFLFDVLIGASGFASPYQFSGAVVPTLSVVGETADFGVAKSFDQEDVLGNVVSSHTGPVNEFGCGGSAPDFNNPNDTRPDTCDIQLELSGTWSFVPPPVSEPAPLMLAGLGLGLAAWAGRRRRQKA